MSEIKKHLGLDLPISTIFAAPTIEQLARIIRTEGWIPPRNCLIEIKTDGSKLPLFMISGGYPLPFNFDHDQPVYGLSFLGMFEKQISRTTLKEIAASYVQSIRTVQPKGPYHLAGHSSGGTLAFEMAQLLDSVGEKIGLLALLDTYGPRSRSLSFLQSLKAHWTTFIRRAPTDRPSYLTFVLNRIVSAATIPLRRMFWLILHRSFLSGQSISLTSTNLSMAYDFAFRNHLVQPYQGRGVLLRAREAKAAFYDAADRGWNGLFTGGLEIHEIPGDHLTMLDEPHVQKVIERLRKCLQTAQLS
jgi:thioesterase domain-containing protein